MTAVSAVLEPIMQAIATAPSASADAAEPAAILRFFGRLHPAAVHFPIGLIVTAGIVEFYGIVRSKSSPYAIAGPCLVIGALAAGLAAWFGWINADLEPHGRSLEQTIFLHRWSGVALAIVAGIGGLLAIGEIGLRRRGKESWLATGYRAALFGAVLLASIGGYLGGEIVFGQNHLLEVFQDRPAQSEGADRMVAEPAAPPSAVTASAASTGADPGTGRIDFATSIEPILRDRCHGCHGEAKGKGGLRLHAKAEVFGADRRFWVIEPGDVEASYLYERITLPADHDERMPARGEPLSATEIALIRDWIDQGADWPDGKPSAAAPAPPVTAPVVEVPAAAAPLPDPAPEIAEVDPAAQQRAVAALRARGAIAMPVAERSSGLDVNLALADGEVGDADLDLLKGLESSLLWLDLSRTAVTDTGLALLGNFTALRRLHLENTAIGDEGLAHLAGMKDLEYLNLYGTAVTDAGLPHLADLAALRKLYLWQTGVTDEGIAELKSRLPDVEIVGAMTLAVAPPAVAPPAEEEPATAEVPDCCAEAKAAGGVCDHPCCVAAAKEGKICEKCAGGAG